MRRFFLAIAILGCACAAGLAHAQSPPRQSAVCVDGSPSFSVTRSGTCSHHGGVGRWLGAADGARSDTPALGASVLLARPTRTSGCRLGAEPDRACSPGAYYSKLTKARICSASFRTSDVRNVPQSVKYSVERAYGMQARHYGSALEIDHIVSLELGGSNDIANLYPELAPGYRVKDVLENRLHTLVCTGAITLHTAQRRIAADWTKLYENVFGKKPVTTGSMRRKP
jgi:Protein of unknown function (DUF3761)